MNNDQLRKNLESLFDKYDVNKKDLKLPDWFEKISWFTLFTEFNILQYKEGFFSVKEFAVMLNDLLKEEINEEKFKLVVKALDFKGRGLSKEAFIELIVFGSKLTAGSDEGDVKEGIEESFENVKKESLSKKGLKEWTEEILNGKEFDENKYKLVAEALSFGWTGIKKENFIELMVTISRLLKVINIEKNSGEGMNK